jgi:hypothetical protein
MVYVFDTNSFLELQSYYPETFPSFGRTLTVSSRTGE